MSYNLYDYWLKTYIGKFFAIFLFFELLPVPINLDVLLVRCDDFVLNFICSFFFLFFLLVAPFVFGVISVCFDLSDCQICLSADLFEITCSKVLGKY